MKKSLVRFGIAAAVIAAFSSGALADIVKISGSTTVFGDIASPARATVEKSTGHTVQLASSNSGKGVVDLADGVIDIAMISEPIEMVGDASEKAGKRVNSNSLQVFELKVDEIVFVVNPANPVRKLTWEQLSDIHTGKVTNWKDLGGNDQPIVVYAGAITGATPAMIKKTVMRGAEYSPAVKMESSVKRSAESVGRDVGGITGIGKGFIITARSRVLTSLKIIETKKVGRPLSMVTFGAPKPAAKAVIEAYAKAAKIL